MRLLLVVPASGQQPGFARSMAENRKAYAVVRKSIMSIGGTFAEMRAANVAFGACLDFGKIALGAVRRALQEIKATGAIATPPARRSRSPCSGNWTRRRLSESVLGGSVVRSICAVGPLR